MKHQWIKQKNVIALVLLLLILVTASGCQKTDIQASEKVPVARETITVEDCLGRQVVIPARATRVGCLYAFTGHVMTMLGAGDRIVATVNGLKRDKLMLELVPTINAALVPHLSGSVNIEELVRANPAFVFVRFDLAANAEEIRKLDECKIPYVVVDYRNMQEQLVAIEVVGKALGLEDKAKAYNDYYRRTVEMVQQRVSGIATEKRIKVYHSVNEATRTDIKGSLPDDWMSAVGVVNVSVMADLKLYENEYYASLEQIYGWDPDVIIANESGVADYILTNEKWAALRAVKSKHVYQMPNGISRWGHPGSLETPLAVLWTAKTLYPEIFSDIDLLKETQNYYRQFFGLTLNDADAQQILDGNGMRIPKQ